MQKPADFHLAVILLEAFGKKHEVIIVAPYDITILIVLAHDVRKHLVRTLICIELRLKAPSSSEPVFLWEAEIVKKWPQDIVAVAIVVLVYNLLVKKNWNASLFLQRKKILGLYRATRTKYGNEVIIQEKSIEIWTYLLS